MDDCSWQRVSRAEFKCRICGRTLASKQRMVQHISSLHQNKTSNSKTKPPKKDCWKISGGKFECTLCTRTLVTKQRVLSHLHLVHNLSPVKREKKLYLDSAAEVPRSTAYRWCKQGNSSALLDKMQDKNQTTHSVNEDSDRSEAHSPNKKVKDDLGLWFHENTTPDELYRYDQSSNSDQARIVTVTDDEHSDFVKSPSPNENSTLDGHYLIDDQSSNLDQARIVTVTDDEHSAKSPSPNENLSDLEMVHSSSDLDCDSEFSSSYDLETVHSSSDWDCDSEFSSSYDSETVHSSSDWDCDSEFSFSYDSDDSCTNSDATTENFGKPNICMPENQSLSILACFLRNKFSASASKDVLDTFKRVFPNSKEVQALGWEEMLSHVNAAMHEIHYCTLCFRQFPSDVEQFRCESQGCDGLRYKGCIGQQHLKTRQPRQAFVFSDIGKQLIDLLQTPGIWEDIQESKAKAYDRMHSGCNILTDILDGQEYRKMMQDGFLKDSDNLTAVFNTDGVNLYSSSKVELWPIFLAINELSPQKRFSRQNILLVGMWQGKGKPPFQEYFRIFSEFMNDLYINGVQVCIQGSVLCVRLKIICGTMDLPAKAELLNMSYYNGPYPCITCEEEGKTVKQGKGTARCLPFRIPGSQSELRKQELLLDHMKIGKPTNRAKGMKGESGISQLNDFDIINGIVPDYMHGVCLGVVKCLLGKWMSTKHKSQDFFIGNNIGEISQRMQSFKPPHFIERLPRNLAKHYQNFKATELQTWLLYYGFPCVEDFLSDDYLTNFLCLSEGIYILLGDNISRGSLQYAEDLLQQFYASFERLYGEGSCGLNVHNTGSHLCQYVKMWGPMWCWSCFPFEDLNSMLLKSVHGTGVVLKQALRYTQAQLCIRRKGLQVNKSDNINIKYEAMNCSVVGSMKPIQQHELEETVREALNNLTGESTHNSLMKLNRIIVNQTRFYSDEYTRMQRRVNTVVMLANGDIGRIQYFILCNENVFAIFEHMQKEVLQRDRVPNYYQKVCNTNNIKVTDVENLKEVLVFIDVPSQNKQYVIRTPNGHGHAIFK